MRTIAVGILLLGLATGWAQNAVQPGALSSPFPTVIHLSVQWLVQGDANLNATVSVQFRAAGDSAWRQGMALRRVVADSNQGFAWPDKFAGSLFDLKPDTEYEIRLSLVDPDGGGEVRTLSARTRPAPAIPTAAQIIDVPAGNHGVLNPTSGTASSPRVYRSADGSAVYDFVELTGKKFVWLWGLTLRSSGANNRAAVKMNNSEGIVIRHCTIDALYGMVAYAPGTRNSYFGDNVITGKVGWADSTMGADGANEGEGIQITGPGNVIAYNRVSRFRDAISTLEDVGGAVEQISIDIYHNDVDVGADDGIEADFCFENCRVLNNRIRNSYVGLSSQPGLGGPTYFIRNAMYNMVHAAFKLKRFSQGDVVLHNTVVKVGAGLAGNDIMDYAYFRNNLAFGGPTGGVNWGGYGAGNPYAADIRDPGAHSSFDYDAVGVSGTPYVARIGSAEFSTVETHGVASLDFAATFPGLSFPNPPVPERPLADLRPALASRVVDAAENIPNVNETYLGRGPDIGAYEAGQPLPHYGPRPPGVVEGSTGIFGRGAFKDGSGIKMVSRMGGLHIRFPRGDPFRGSIRLYDLQGSLLREIPLSPTSDGLWIPAAQLPKGVVLLRWKDEVVKAFSQ